MGEKVKIINKLMEGVNIEEGEEEMEIEES